MRTKFIIDSSIKNVIPLPDPSYTKSATQVDAGEVLSHVEHVLRCLRSERVQWKKHPEILPRNVGKQFDTLTGIFEFSPDSLCPVMGAWRGYESSLIEYGFELAKVAGVSTTVLENSFGGGDTPPWWVGERRVHEQQHHPICDQLFIDRPL